MSWIVQKWHSLTAGSWRGLSTSDFWNEYDAVIATTEEGRGGRGNSYEVWTYGTLIATRPTLEEAQGMVEETYGPLKWETIKSKSITVVHQFYGPSDEWTDPVILHIVRKLPRL